MSCALARHIDDSSRDTIFKETRSYYRDLNDYQYCHCKTQIQSQIDLKLIQLLVWVSF